MLATRLNISLANNTVSGLHSNFIFGKWSFMKLYGKSYFHRGKIYSDNLPASGRVSEYLIKRATPVVESKLFNSIKVGSVSLHQTSWRNFASANLQEAADVFGDLGDKQYEKTDMDEFELQEEEFLKNEAKQPRRLVPSPGRYADMIKRHIQSGDLKAAVDVLDQIKKDRNEPNEYMYNLLIRALAMQGQLKKCFSLYNRMKKQNLKPTSPTYVSLLNACANSDRSQLALEKLNDIRQLFVEKQIKLNPVHYNVMIKVYGRHGKLLEAFQLVDEMRDQKLTIGISTCNFLLQGSITDKDAGFRHSLVVWHILRCRNLKPDIYTYNLLLRSARDCKLGKFNVRDLLVSPSPEEPPAEITYSDRINLLAYPPVLSQTMPLISDSKKCTDTDPDDNLQHTRESTELVAVKESDSMLEPAVESTDTVPDVYLESSSPERNLILMGGFNNFIDQMKKDNVQPDIKTITFLMELVPPTESAEKAVLKYAKAMGVQLDVDFYNLLIKKRSFRFEYDSAQKVLELMQRDHLEPNIMTWGVMALTCRKTAQVRELLEGIELTGQRINVQIIGAIVKQGYHHWNFGIVLEMMEIMRREGIKPSPKLYELLESLRKRAAQVSRDKKSPDFVRQPIWQNGYRKFNLRYPTWVKEMKADPKDRKKESV